LGEPRLQRAQLTLAQGHVVHQIPRALAVGSRHGRDGRAHFGLELEQFTLQLPELIGYLN
jgi:hypothetical protein